MIKETYGCIYGLQSPSGKWYIGQTTKEPYGYIRSNYKRDLGGDRPKLHNAILKYGFDNFKVTIFSECCDKESLDSLEIKLISDFNSIKNGYNIREGGSRGKLAKETKQKLSVSKKLYYANGGKKTNLGVKYSKERCLQMSLSRLGMPAPNRGLPMSEGQKVLISKNRIDSGVAKGIRNPRAKIRTIVNLETKEEYTGTLKELSERFHFCRIKILNGKTGRWQLINKADITASTQKEKTND